MDSVWLLSLIVFLPVAGAAALALFPKDWIDGIRYWTLGITLAILALCVYGFWSAGETRFDIHQSGLQTVVFKNWIPSFGINYFLGVDGFSFPLLILTAVVSVLAMGASWSITKYVKGYCILFLLLESGMLGVFVSLDLFLFYVFWEVMLLPMYFLIGVWGGPRREYAAIKFFLYTLAGSVLMLVAILMLYFSSDLRALAKVATAEGSRVEWASLSLPHSAEHYLECKEVQHTFNIPALSAIGQHTDCFSQRVQWWAFLLLFIGFAIKVPSVPVHTWLPDAHVEAPTPISMILAGVLLKMGGYGIIRICYPICPFGGYDLAYWICGIGVISMIYGGFAALAQKDFKRLVAYSSVSHMGYVVAGLSVWSVRNFSSVAAGTEITGDYWNMGIQGAMYQMIAHGVSSAGMFFMVGVVYDRVHHRNLEEFGGLFGRMPVYTALAIGLFFAGLGLPGLCGFIGEVLVVLSIWKFSPVLAVLSASVVIITAGYILWCVQRVFLGPEYRGPHGEHLHPSDFRENLIAGILFAGAIFFGVFPETAFGVPSVLSYVKGSAGKYVDDLTAWTKAHEARVEAAAKDGGLEISKARDIVDSIARD